MIHYQLRCDADHRFDGWFKSSSAFDAQSKGGWVACPECGGTRVNRALMAPAIARKSAVTAPQAIEAAPETAPDKATTPDTVIPEKAAAGLPDKVRAVLQRIRAEVERSSDYVGPDFAVEARRIHRGESQARSIYGESSEAEAEALADDGIEFTQIPWVPRADG